MARDPYVMLLGSLGAVPGTEENPTAAPPPPPPAAKAPAPSGWPAAAVPRADAWTIDGGRVKYRIHRGDTLSGLARTYLGQYERVKEWIRANPDRNPDRIPVGDLINAPPDAIRNAKSRGFLPFYVSGRTGKSHKAWWIGGGVGAALLGAGGIAWHETHT